MTSPVLPYYPSKRTQDAILQYSRAASFLANQQIDMREKLLWADKQYQRQTDLTVNQRKAIEAARRGDPTKFQNIVLPVIMPQIESAVAYQTSVFLQGTPIFGVVAPPQFVDQGTQMDAIIEDQQVRGGWVQEFIKGFRDGFKYNLMAMETDWKRQVSFAPDSNKEKEVIWEGNKIRKLDLYNSFWDPRVSPDQVAEFGEFAGYNELMSKIRLKQFINSLPYNINVTAAFESGIGTEFAIGSGGYDGYYIPNINPDAFINQAIWQDTNWLEWAGMEKTGNGAKINYKNCYLVKTLYGRILPNEFAMNGVPGQNTPQVWKFIIVNNSQIIYAERLTNAHGLIPIVFAQPLNDGLAYQTKSFSQNLEPIQSLSTAVANSDISSRRRAVSDRVLYDSSRISAAHINNDNPASKIPVRPSAAGQPVGASVYQFPFNDNLFQLNSAALQQYLAIGNQITGFNPVRQGQFVKGNKTRQEFDTVMANSNGRDQLVAMSIEADLMTPIKEILKINILQYQGGTTLFQRETKTVVSVDPVALRTANFAFRISDGLIPSETLMDGQAFQGALQTMMAIPQLASQYNAAPMFSYLLKTQGADIKPFEKSQPQIQYEQAMAQWQQATQVIAQQLQSNKQLDQDGIQQLLSQLPPQPKPEDYGWDPNSVSSGGIENNVNLNPGAPTLLQQTLSITQQGQQASPANQSQQGNGTND